MMQLQRMLQEKKDKAGRFSPFLHISNSGQADGYRSAQTPVSTLSSAPDEADNCGSVRCFTACSRAWRCGRSWRECVCVCICVCGWVGGGIQGWLDSLQSAVRNRQETFNQLVCIRQDGTIAPARHKAGQRHRSQMLSPSLQWHANSIFIKVGSLFALSGLIHGRDFYLLVGDRFCMCVKFC